MKKFLTAKNGLYAASALSIAAGVAGIVLNAKFCDDADDVVPVDDDEIMPNDPFADAEADQT